MLLFRQSIKRFYCRILNLNENLLLKAPLSNRKEEESLLKRYLKQGMPRAVCFNFGEMKNATLAFVESLKIGKETGVYKYADSTKTSNLYSSIYACMIRSLYGDLEELPDKGKRHWVGYFDSFQSVDDGLFRDPTIYNELFENSDWWGARHLLCHIIIAYTELGARPRYPFRFLEQYYDKQYVIEWLESMDWDSFFPFKDDIDNKIMNIGAALQYSRDMLANRHAQNSLKLMMDWLINKIKMESGLWGTAVLDTTEKISRAVQFAYHLYTLYHYDGWDILYKNKIIDYVLKTQNKFGGYGIDLNSSACDDIDSVELLCRLTRKTDYRKEDIKLSLVRALPWVLSNMNDDGGFVFQRNLPLVYGHEEMSSRANESTMFATWFRTLCLAYLTKQLNLPNNYHLIRCPGYEFE